VSAYRLRAALARKDALGEVAGLLRDAAACVAGEVATAPPAWLTLAAGGASDLAPLCAVLRHATLPSWTLRCDGGASSCAACVIAAAAAGTPDGVWVVKQPATNNALGVHVVSGGLPALLLALRELHALPPSASDDGPPPHTCRRADGGSGCADGGSGDGASSGTTSGTTSGMREGIVIQPYAGNLCTIGGAKFHLRVNVLAAGAAHVFMHHHVMCHVATAPYVRGDWGSRAVHITNHCVQRAAPGYDAARHTLDLTAVVVGSMDGGCGCGALLRARIAAVVRAVFAAATTGRRTSGARLPFLPARNAFEHYGFDFLVTRGGHPCLLEVNAGPALEGLAAPAVCAAVVEDTAALLFDDLLAAPADGVPTAAADVEDYWPRCTCAAPAAACHTPEIAALLPAVHFGGGGGDAPGPWLHLLSLPPSDSDSAAAVTTLTRRLPAPAWCTPAMVRAVRAAIVTAAAADSDSDSDAADSS